MCIGQMSIHNCCSKHPNPRGYLADAGRVPRMASTVTVSQHKKTASRACWKFCYTQLTPLIAQYHYVVCW